MTSFVISRTPYRVSFFGGGTDYLDWYTLHGGAVLSTTIDKYCYISCRYYPPYFDVRYRIVWHHIETVNSIAEILHPAVREGLWHLGYDESSSIELHHQGDLPSRAGVGTSSAFSVGLVKALSALKGQPIEGLDLARSAIALERERLGEPVGSQDQVASACGGFNMIEFHPGGEIEVCPVRVTQARRADLASHLMLFFTGTSRLGATITVDLIKNLSKRTDQLHAMRRMVDRAIAIVEGSGDLSAFGELLDETWKHKRSLSSKITNSAIDDHYQRAITAGALGGKLLGAGGSGFMLFFVPPERQEQVKTALSPCQTVPFGFAEGGSTLMYP